MKMESLAQRISSRPALLLKSQGSLERLSLHHGCILLGPALQRKHVLGAGKFVSTTLTPQLELGCPSLQLPLFHCIRAPVPGLPPEGPCTR